MATSRLRDICIDCIDPDRVAHFWAAVLGYTMHPSDPATTPDESDCPPSARGWAAYLVQQSARAKGRKESYPYRY